MITPVGPQTTIACTDDGTIDPIPDVPPPPTVPPPQPLPPLSETVRNKDVPAELARLQAMGYTVTQTKLKGGYTRLDAK